MGGLFRAAKRVVSSAARTATNIISKTASAVGNAASNVIKNPLPVIETIALTSVGIPPSIASAAVTAANGGNVKDVATAAVTAYVGGEAGQTVGGQVASATESKVLGSIAASATGASTQATLTGLAQGKGLKDSLASGLQAGVAAGLTQTAIEQISPTTGPTPVEERSVGVGTEMPTGNAAVGDISQEVAAAQKAKPEAYVTLPTEQKLLQSALYPSVYTTLFGQKAQPSLAGAPATTTAPTTTPTSPTQTTITPGSQALAQALRIGDVGAPIFGTDKDEGKKAGWNVESLRYMGNVGEA